MPWPDHRLKTPSDWPMTRPLRRNATASFASNSCQHDLDDVTLLLPLLEELIGRDLSLFVTMLLHLLVDPPLVAERIDELSVTSSPEHVLHGHAHARAGSHSALDNRVRIVHHEGDTDARSPERFRRLAGSTFARGELVADEELVSVQSQFAVHELLAARLDHSVHFLRTKDAFVEVKRGEPATHDQFGDELVLSKHSLLLDSRVLLDRTTLRAHNWSDCAPPAAGGC